MKVYTAQTRARVLMERLSGLGIGEIVQPAERRPRRRPWVLDNGAFSDWRSGRPFDDMAFRSSCAWADEQAPPDRPDWVVCPDRVATGRESLAFSLGWLDSHGVAFPGLRWYLAVQDGMTSHDVEPVASRFVGLFVGGSMKWKIETAAMWSALAHRLGMGCHVGRVGTMSRARWAMRTGVDSIDSALPLWSTGNLDRFLRALDEKPATLKFDGAGFWDASHSGRDRRPIARRPVESSGQATLALGDDE